MSVSLSFKFILLIFFPFALCYKPVIFLHGINSKQDAGNDFKNWLSHAHPGQSFVSLPVFQGDPQSFVSLPIQVASIRGYIKSLTKLHPLVYGGGYHLVGHSQGGLITRCLVESFDDHKVINYLSLAGPQMGVYGDMWIKKIAKKYPIVDKFALSEVYKVLYTKDFQNVLSVANMWHDAGHEEAFLKGNVFLPEFNGLNTTSANLTRYKQNFIRLNKAVFAVGHFNGRTDEGGIDPWFAGVWDYYDARNKKMVPMIEQSLYVNDTFGLRTLNEQGKLVLDVQSGVSHGDWIHNYNIWSKHVLPHLT